MNDIVGSALGALALIGIPIVGWLSRRVTREGRLMMRIERLGALIEAIPASAERDALSGYLFAASRDLLWWIEPANRRRRFISGTISTVLYVIVVTGLVGLTVTWDVLRGNPLLQVVLGLFGGAAISGASLGVSFLLKRSEKARASDQAVADAQELRIKQEAALRTGDPFPTAKE